MKLKINGQEREVPGGITLGGLLDFLKIDPRRVVVEINRQIINRRQWQEHTATLLAEGDELEIVQLVGGG